MQQIILIHKEAPAKPELGAACNGCGICCLAEPCPLGQIRFLQRKGKCPALIWLPSQKNYQCGLLQNKSFWPLGLHRIFTPRVVARWIAAGKGCDAAVSISEP